MNENFTIDLISETVYFLLDHYFVILKELSENNQVLIYMRLV